MPRQDEGIAIVIILAGEEIGARIAVALAGRVPVVEMGRQLVHAEPVVGVRQDRQRIIVAEQHWHAIARHDQLGGERAVERPQRTGVLDRQLGVQSHLDARRSSARSPHCSKGRQGRIRCRRQSGAAARHRAGRYWCGHRRSRSGHIAPGENSVAALVREIFARGAALDRAFRQPVAQACVDLAQPRILVLVVGGLARRGPQRLASGNCRARRWRARHCTPRAPAAWARSHRSRAALAPSSSNSMSFCEKGVAPLSSGLRGAPVGMPSGSTCARAGAANAMHPSVEQANKARRVTMVREVMANPLTPAPEFRNFRQITRRFSPDFVDSARRHSSLGIKGIGNALLLSRVGHARRVPRTA